MATQAKRAISKTSALGVSPQEINQILAGKGVIEGKPREAVRDLKIALEKVNGKTVAIPCKDGITREYKTSYYAEVVGRSKMAEAVRQSQQDRYQSQGVDLVRIVGGISTNPCTQLVGHVYSLSGTSQKYPAFSTVSEGQLPWKLFHPQCSKSTSPYIEGLSKPAATGGQRSAAA